MGYLKTGSNRGGNLIVEQVAVTGELGGGGQNDHSARAQKLAFSAAASVASSWHRRNGRLRGFLLPAAGVDVAPRKEMSEEKEV